MRRGPFLLNLYSKFNPMRKTFYSIFALLLLGAMLFPGCSENPENGDPTTVKTYTMTIIADKGEIVAKALNVEGNTLKASSWALYAVRWTRSGYIVEGSGRSLSVLQSC